MVTREPNGSAAATTCPGTMAPGGEKSIKGKSSNAPLLQQLLWEEELAKKAVDYEKLVKSWVWGTVLCVQREKLESRVLVKSCQNLRAGVVKELSFAHQALVMVRRAALRCLLQREHLQHQRELNLQGKSFYAERL